MLPFPKARLISGVLNPEGELALELPEEESSSSESEEEVSRSDSVSPANMSVLFSRLTSILVELEITRAKGRLRTFGSAAAVFSSLLFRKEREEIKFSDIFPGCVSHFTI